MRILMIVNGKVGAQISGRALAEVVTSNPGYEFVEDAGFGDAVGMDYVNGVLSGAPIGASQAKINSRVAKSQARAKAVADAAAAKADTKLATLASMSPAQARAWVAANVTNLADAKDILATLAVAVSILARRL